MGGGVMGMEERVFQLPYLPEYKSHIETRIDFSFSCSETYSLNIPQTK